MEEVIKIFKQIQETSGKNDKQSIITKNKNNELFKKCLIFLLDCNVVTVISKAKINKRLDLTGCITIDKASFGTIMGYIEENNTGRDSDISIVQSFIENQPEEYREFYRDMVTKSLRLGVDEKTVNKAIPNLIRTFNVMLAQKYWDCMDSVKGKEFIITQKLDGNRLVAVYEDDIKLYTRQGKFVTGLLDIENDIKLNLHKGYVYDGEVILRNDNNLPSDELFRETMKVVRKDGIKNNLVFHVFDVIAINSFFNGIDKVECSVRKEFIHKEVQNMEWVKEVPVLYKGYDTNMITKLLDEQIALGHEGVMVNLADAPYECKRSKQILKVKRMQTADVRCIDIIEGDGANKNRLGAITFEFIHEDKIHTCNCGSGFSEQQRIDFWNNPDGIIGKIVEVSYFEISTNQKDDSYSMRFPVFKMLRLEKSEISMF